MTGDGLSVLAGVAGFLRPYEWQPMVSLAVAVALLLYLRGIACGARPGVVRAAAFLVGLGAMYAVTQTRFDYFAQYVFFIHRLQHLVLHHIAAILIVLANPLPVLAAGMPAPVRDRVIAPAWRSAPVQGVYRFVQHPLVASLLFVGLIYLWLTPAVHYNAMLSRELYTVMNWSMAIDGLLFWWLALDPRPPGPGHYAIGFGKRCLMLAAVAFPQIWLGAYIVIEGGGIYDYYEVCGSPWPIDATTDRVLGGIFTWIPAAMMSVLGTVIVLAYWYRSERGPTSTH
ncbi:hypothetical protein KBTX_00334 [wastewater metagenome]|uniref:Cytochrome c oxidase assembly protein n=2 Tax=unclassified sequences TaxID=12908 RepID=A0A5B8R7Z0_9ZZZZ|nr:MULTISPECIES: cytochrome c oxidase assembly protein [Arhodomonas]MCS4505132.1 cytochrome c oxidase assembly protein [Arhodomonas aquaeolei]QEA04033.1 hypothetical protein KBTEX_00334 [uncultured organism]